jgi:hypothetical protein
MICSGCTRPVPDDARFCPACGRAVEAAPAAEGSAGDPPRSEPAAATPPREPAAIPGSPPAMPWRVMPVSPPSPMDWLRQGWHVFFQRPGVLILGTLLYLCVATLPTIFRFISLRGQRGGYSWGTQSHPELFLEIGFILALIPMRLGFSLYCLAVIRGEDPAPTVLLSGYARPWAIVGVDLVLGLAVGIGFLLLIVPGLVLAVALCFAPLFLIDRGVGIFGALQGCWELSSGYRWRIGGLLVLIVLAAIPIVLLTCGLGALMFEGFTSGALAAAYQDLLERKGLATPRAHDVTQGTFWTP